MKDLITAIASIFLLMIFVMQFAAAQGTHHQMLQADMAVASFRDSLKEEGGVSTGNRNALCRSLAEICRCSEDEILVEEIVRTTVPERKGKLIYYRVGYPLKHLIAAATALGITEDENQVYYEQEGWVVSSYEEPYYNDGDSISDVDGGTV